MGKCRYWELERLVFGTVTEVGRQPATGYQQSEADGETGQAVRVSRSLDRGRARGPGWGGELWEGMAGEGERRIGLPLRPSEVRHSPVKSKAGWETAASDCSRGRTDEKLSGPESREGRAVVWAAGHGAEAAAEGRACSASASRARCR